MPHVSALGLLCLAMVLAGCAAKEPVASVCSMRATPEEFVGVHVELSGFANVWRHGVSLEDPACPELAIALSEPPENKEDSPTSKFFLSLPFDISPDAPSIPVTIRGKLTKHSGQLPPYVFVVESGSIRNASGG